MFFFDYFVIGKLDVDSVVWIVEGIVKGCEDFGCVLIGGEIVEMLGMYFDGDFDFVGFVVGVMECGVDLLVDVVEGDVLLGLVLNGVYLNGYSFVCKVVEMFGLLWGDVVLFGDVLLGEELLVLICFYVK